MAILVLAIAVVLRAIPELVAYPYPVGYDVVNYYIPVVTNFEEHWPDAAGQFPLYVLILYFTGIATGLPTHSVVVGVAVAVFGIFGMSLFYLARSLLKLGTSQSVFLAVFVIFQMAVLRTAWDLHRDIFALAAMMFAFSLLGRKDAGWKVIAALLALAALTVAADRMIGVLFCLSLAAYAVITRRRVASLTAIFAAGLFSLLMIASYASTGVGDGSAGASSETTETFYNPLNLIIFFAVVNGLLAVPAAVGFLRMKGSLLKIPLLVSLAGSFSWMVFPNTELFVADRWTILSGIFLSVFAGYGLLHIARRLIPNFALPLAGSVLVAFAVTGVEYAIMPHDSPFILYGIARGNTENFGPVTMQFNSLDVRDSGKILSAIEWINQNTEHDAVIVGEKHWRGFMELHLEGQRTYRFSEDPETLAEALDQKGRHAYLVWFDSSVPEMFTVEDMNRR